MRKPPHAAERFRITAGRFASDPGYGNNGLFLMSGPAGRELAIIASDQAGWEHVSVSVRNRCPNWPEMCAVKDLFWAEDEVVVQYHPAKADYVNQHPYTLHLWRPVGVQIPTPPAILVGVKDLANPSAEELAAILAWSGA